MWQYVTVSCGNVAVQWILGELQQYLQMQCHHVINWPIISVWSRVLRPNRNDWPINHVMTLHLQILLQLS